MPFAYIGIDSNVGSILWVWSYSTRVWDTYIGIYYEVRNGVTFNMQNSTQITLQAGLLAALSLILIFFGERTDANTIVAAILGATSSIILAIALATGALEDKK